MKLTYNVKPTVPAVFNSNTALTIAENRDKFQALEDALFSLPQLADEDYDLVEYKSGGLYGRQFTIKKGVCVTGRVYKRDHLEIMLSGDVVILAADGGTKRYTGFNVIEAKAGKRQAGFALEDTVWLTVNIVPEDVEEPLEYTSVVGFEAFNDYIMEVNLTDYQELLVQLQLTEEQMQEIVTVEDIVDLPEAYSHIYVSESRLSGKGLFSKLDIKEGDLVCPTRIGDSRTIAGRYSNHALVANTKPVVVDNQFFIQASRNIPTGEEITMNYRDILKFRQDKGDL